MSPGDEDVEALLAKAEELRKEGKSHGRGSRAPSSPAKSVFETVESGSRPDTTLNVVFVPPIY
jgi:hypothetical protein